MIFKKNIFDIEFLTKVVQDIKLLQSEPRWVINKYFWEIRLFENLSGNVLISDSIHPDIRETIESTIFNALDIDKKKIKSMSMAYYIWEYGSGIHWHTDSHADVGITLYLDQYWKPEYGGILEYIKDGRHAFVPEFGAISVNANQTLHRVTPINYNSRKTVQLFIQYDSELS